MKFAAAATVAGSLIGLVAAQTCSTPADPNKQSGNPIRAPLTQIVQAGVPFNIIWDNTTAGDISIELLRGPSTNIVPIKCLVDNIPNIGKFVWTPDSSLTPDVTHYGLRIIVTGTGQFQYSNQFGISNDAVHQPTSSSTVPTTSGTITTKTGSSTTPVTTTSVSAPTVTTSVPLSSVTGHATASAGIATTLATNSSMMVVIATTHIPVPLTVSGKPTYPILQPSKNMTIPGSLQTSKTSIITEVTASASATFSSLTGTGSPIASPTGTSAPNSGAGKILAGSVLAGLGAIAALVL
ncbi:MAG: hypothetical protein Q9220_006726 [cf. Caloplaca sp. 1 TL-2023]